MTEIVKTLEAMRSQVHIILTLDTLEFAKRSGRVGTLSAALASVLNVKPIARLQDGVVHMVEKVRTRKVALARVIELGKEVYGDRPVSIGVLHARDLESGKIPDGGCEEAFQRQGCRTDRSFHLPCH